MTTTYKILFSIDLLNEYYNNLQCRDFTIIPSAETILLLKNKQLQCKLVGNKLVVLVKVKNDISEPAELNKPFIEIGDQGKFVFYLDLDRSAFMSISNIDLDALRSKRFYFTNLHKNSVGTNLYLSAPIADYDDTITYTPGNLVDDGAGMIFECIQATAGGNDTGDADFWRSKGGFQYPSVADMISFSTRIRNYHVAAEANVFSIKAFGLDRATGDYTNEIILEKNIVTTGNTKTKEVPVDLSVLSPGKYIIEINGEPFDVYIDDTALYNNYFGVIEIFTHLSNGDDFALLDINGKVKDTIVAGKPVWLNYAIRFANRLAFWKYITPRQGVKSIKDQTSIYSFTQSPVLPALPDYFQSDEPIPLYESPSLFDLELVNAVSNDPPQAPNPDPQVTGMLTRAGSDFFCTIFLNY